MEKWLKWSHLTLNHLKKKWSRIVESLRPGCLYSNWRRDSKNQSQKDSNFWHLKRNIYLGKLENFSLMTWTSLFGKHEILDCKTIAEPSYMQTGTHLRSRIACWGTSSQENMGTHLFFPFTHKKIRKYCRRQIIKTAELIYWPGQNVHAVPFYIALSKEVMFANRNYVTLKKD